MVYTALVQTDNDGLGTSQKSRDVFILMRVYNF